MRENLTYGLMRRGWQSQPFTLLNYHIAVDKMHYSVPYESIMHKVEVRITRGVIEVFYNHHRICSHLRLYGRPGQYHTLTDHMPDKHKPYAQWNAERFIAWAEQVGPSTAVVIRAILTGHRVEQQSYKACMGVLKLADRYSLVRVEAACARALGYTPNPGFKHVSTILKSGQDRAVDEQAATIEAEMTTRHANPHDFTRGASYYGVEKITMVNETTVSKLISMKLSVIGVWIKLKCCGCPPATLFKRSITSS